MTRAILPSISSAKIALRDLNGSIEKASLTNVIKDVKVKSPRIFLNKTAIKRIIMQSMSFIAKYNSQYYLKWKNSSMYFSFKLAEERKLVSKILDSLKSKPFFCYFVRNFKSLESLTRNI